MHARGPMSGSVCRPRTPDLFLFHVLEFSVEELCDSVTSLVRPTSGDKPVQSPVHSVDMNIASTDGLRSFECSLHILFETF